MPPQTYSPLAAIRGTLRFSNQRSLETVQVSFRDLAGP